MTLELQVELVPHVGEMQTDLGIVKVNLDQYQIKVTSAEYTKNTGKPFLIAGYVGKVPGRPINFLPIANQWPESVQDQIAAAVKEELAKLNPEKEADAERKTHHAIDPDTEQKIDEAIASGSGAATDTAGDEQNI